MRFFLLGGGKKSEWQTIVMGACHFKGVSKHIGSKKKETVENRNMPFSTQTGLLTAQPQMGHYSHISNALTQAQMVAGSEETLIICRMLLGYLWRGQLPQGRGKGSSLANPACNKHYNTILFKPPKLILCQQGIGMQEKAFLQSYFPV